MKVAIADYGAGNLRSLASALVRAGVEPEVTVDPRIVREAFRRRAHIVFPDESGFQLNPSVRRTLAPGGRTPVLEAWDRRDRISAIGCVTTSPVRARPGLYLRFPKVSGHEVNGVDSAQGVHRWPVPDRRTRPSSSSRPSR